EAIGARVASADDDDVLAAGKNVAGRVERVAMTPLVLLRQKFHREMDALQFATGNSKISRLFGTTGENDRIVITTQIFGRNVFPDFGVGYKLHALGRHLIETAINDVFFEFEFGYPVTK